MEAPLNSLLETPIDTGMFPAHLSARAAFVAEIYFLSKKQKNVCELFRKYFVSRKPEETLQARLPAAVQEMSPRSKPDSRERRKSSPKTFLVRTNEETRYSVYRNCITKKEVR